MKAILLDGFGGREVLKIGEREKPLPASGQVLIRVKATSVNRADIVQRQGNYPPPPGESDVLGLEAAGTVETVGPEVFGWKPGDRVMSLVGGGGYAEYAVASAGHLLPVPDTLTDVEAACVCEVYITAFLNIFLIGGLKDSDAILLHGGGGGVNCAAIQLCRALVPRARIFVTASPGKVDRVKALGADGVINYREERFAERIREFTRGKGVDMILDHIGSDYFNANMKALAVGGKLLVIGVMSGAAAELNLARLMVNRQQIIGSVLRARPVAEKAKIVAAFKKDVLPKFADRTVVPMVDRSFPLEQAALAHQTMEESRHFGKIVLKID